MLAFALLGLLGIGLMFWTGDDDSSDTDTPPEGEEGLNKIEGTEESDILEGTSAADYVLGLGGADLLVGDGGSDVMNGGSGDDLLMGMKGADTLRGGEGDDILIGGDGADELKGGDGDDLIYSAEFVDEEALLDIMTSPMTDTFYEDVAEATMPHDDFQDAPDTVWGGDGEDLIVAGSGDYIASGAGEDVVVLGDWVKAGDPVIITDYDATARDIYEYSYGPDAEAPTLSFELDEEGNAHIFADDDAVMIVMRAGDDFDLGTFSVSQRAA